MFYPKLIITVHDYNLINDKFKNKMTHQISDLYIKKPQNKQYIFTPHSFRTKWQITTT